MFNRTVRFGGGWLGGLGVEVSSGGGVGVRFREKFFRRLVRES